jgi:hypothetical protein
VDVEYIEGDVFGKKLVKNRKEINIRPGLGLQISTQGNGREPLSGISMQG